MSETSVNDTEKEMIVIRGNVKDKKGTPLPGVTILIKGTTIGVSTDVKGEYTMNVEKQDSLVLQFSFIGMKTTFSPAPKTSWTALMTVEMALAKFSSSWKRWIPTLIFQSVSSWVWASTNGLDAKDRAIKAESRNLLGIRICSVEQTVCD